MWTMLRCHLISINTAEIQTKMLVLPATDHITTLISVFARNFFMMLVIQ